MSFSVDKDVQRLLRAIAGQGEPLSLCTWGGGRGAGQGGGV